MTIEPWWWYNWNHLWLNLADVWFIPSPFRWRRPWEFVFPFLPPLPPIFFFIFSPFLMTCRIFSGYASEMFSEIVNNSCIQTCGAWLFYSFSLGYSESVMDGFQDSRLFSEIGPSLELKHLIESNGISSTEDSMGSIDGAEAPHRNPHPTSNKWRVNK